ncbi:hypothetical protein JRQ81_014367 [Phrynocephalus forsythii]|uniref:Uncharacterized protein n=1 Tax=Phrynocephalus forsythii TaxID=171643 RepID=A0A9Q0XZU9_9SAUR|nr:hypothetical protein JRQ81_014367 [Phrynocephalus forsythii]
MSPGLVSMEDVIKKAGHYCKSAHLCDSPNQVQSTRNVTDNMSASWSRCGLHPQDQQSLGYVLAREQATLDGIPKASLPTHQHAGHLRHLFAQQQQQLRLL